MLGFGPILLNCSSLVPSILIFDKYDIRPDAYSLLLSQKGAEATVEYMISKGISADRLHAQGYGDTRLVNDCDDGVPCLAKNDEMNRRSEFIIFE